MAAGTEMWRVHPGRPLDLDHIDPASVSGAPGDKATTEAALAELQLRLRQLQARLAAERSRSLLVVLQGLDTAGKDGTVDHVFSGINPQGAKVASFKQPTAAELAHDFLWRVHRQAPAAGEIGIFNRSHYEDVLVVRVEKLAPRRVWRARYAHINAFERLLAHGGTTVAKFFLHISYAEQTARLRDRLDQPDKRWKLSPADFTERSRFGDYQAAYAEALAKTSTDEAPWYAIPANHKWFRNYAVSRVLVETLEAMDPRFPHPPDLDALSFS